MFNISFAHCIAKIFSLFKRSDNAITSKPSSYKAKPGEVFTF